MKPAYCAGGLPIESQNPTSATYVACREHNWLPCFLSIGQQVSHQRWIWGIHCVQARMHTSNGSTLPLKHRPDVTRSLKQGYQWSHERTCVLQKFKKKKWSHYKASFHGLCGFVIFCQLSWHIFNCCTSKKYFIPLKLKTCNLATLLVTLDTYDL